MLIEDRFILSNMPPSRCENLTVLDKPPNRGFFIKEDICIEMEEERELKMVFIIKLL